MNQKKKKKKGSLAAWALEVWAEGMAQVIPVGRRCVRSKAEGTAVQQNPLISVWVLKS